MLMRKNGGNMRKAMVVAAVLAGLAMAGSWRVLARGTAGQNAAPRVIEISAKKYEFDPAEIKVKKGEKVELKVHSVDETHGVKLSPYPEGTKDKGMPGLAFEQPEANGKVTKGTDQVLDFVAQQEGTYDFACAKVCGLGHGKMKGKLIVEP
jgi:cytochrome c oxidase subunit II